MSFLNALEISAAGMMSERLRLDISASNLANVDSTRTPEGGPYRKKIPVLESVPLSFDTALEKQMLGGSKLHTVRVAGVVESQDPFDFEFNPSHPDANEEGYVARPNISVVEEMVNMMKASRAYEANITALNTSKGLLLRTLDIGSM